MIEGMESQTPEGNVLLEVPGHVSVCYAHSWNWIH